MNIITSLYIEAIYDLKYMREYIQLYYYNYI